MKRFVSIILFCCSLHGSAQNWASFPLDETSEWHVVTSSLYTGSGHCMLNRVNDYSIVDTVVQNGHEYFHFEYQSTAWTEPLTPNPNYPCHELWGPVTHTDSAGLVRSSGGIIYQATNTAEQVLYDFTLEAGDTGQWEGHLPYIVDSTDRVLVGDQLCKRLWVHVLEANSIPVWIVESVGHQRGLFETMLEFENTGHMCYKEHGAPVIYSDRDGFSNPCFITSIDNIDAEATLVTPNPSPGIFRIKSQKNFSFQVFDLFGKMVHEGNSSGQSIIDLTSQPIGIYLLRIDSDNGSFIHKLVKK